MVKELKGKHYLPVEGMCADCHIGLSIHCSDCGLEGGKCWREVKPVTEQSSATAKGYLTVETDKTRKESAEREIVAILERLNGQIEMRIACVSTDIKTDKQAFESKVTILLK